MILELKTLCEYDSFNIKTPFTNHSLILRADISKSLYRDGHTSVMNCWVTAVVK